MWTRISILFITCSVLGGVHNRGVLADTGYFWHVSDFHYDDSYGQTAGQSCHLPVPQPGPFGNGSCDSPWRLIEDTLRNMAALKADVDFILWTGDNAGHIPTPEFSQERNLKLIHAVTSAINQTFPGATVVPSLGNHDFFPADYTNGTERSLYDFVCDLWAPWIGDPAQVQICRGGGFFSKLVRPKLRVLSVNTILYLIENPKVKNLTDPARQFEWLNDTLQYARRAGEKVIVTAHVPPTIPAPFVINWFYPQYQGRYVDLMTNFSDVIIAHHYGHEHADAFKILQREDGSGATPVFLAPSVTPLRGMSPAGHQSPRHNPGVRLVHYDRSTYRHLGYSQFHTNITDGNSQGHTLWTELYNFQDAYNASDMSVASLRKIVAQMSKPFSPTMLQYCSFYLVTGTPDTVCTVEQQGAFWCAAQYTDIYKTLKCVQDYVHRFRKDAWRWLCIKSGLPCKSIQ